jgi:lysophospholipase L1-like esterase
MVRRTIIAAALTFSAACSMFKSGTEPTPTPENAVNYEALGASDTIGIGSSQPCLPFTECTTGPGYVQQVARRLQVAGKTVTLNNLGVPGAVLSPAVQAIALDLGLDTLRNVLQDEAPYVRRSSTLVTLFIGANDANAVGKAVRAGRGGSNPAAYVQAHVEAFARDMKTFVTTVRSRTSTARIVALNLPNMANTPYAAPLTLDEKRYLQTISVGFSAGINALAAEGVTVVDLMCDPGFYNPAIFSSDGFHPNDSGYGYMADLVYVAATSTATTPAPRSSCSFMNVF